MPRIDVAVTVTASVATGAVVAVIVRLVIDASRHRREMRWRDEYANVIQDALAGRSWNDSALLPGPRWQPGSMLAPFAFLVGRARREDIEAIMTDLWLDAEEMRSRGFSRRWILFIMKARELRELAALLWQWIREIWVPRPGRGR